MSGPADTGRFPKPAVVDPAQLPLATPSAPGAMSALDRSRFVYDEILTSVGGAVDGDVVRRVSAGVWTPAASDTAAHCAGPLGVYRDSAVVPISGNSSKINFVATPTLGAPAYLSTTAGKLTNTVPSPLAITLYLGVPYVDLSVGAAYSAKVDNMVAAAPSMSIDQKLLALAAQDLGGSPSDYDVMYDPCSAMTINPSTNGPYWGSLGGAGAWIAKTDPHMASLHSSNGTGYGFGSYARWTQANPAANTALIAMRCSMSAAGERVLYLSATGVLIAIGVWDNAGGGSAVNAANFCLLHGATTPPSYHQVFTAPNVTDLGVAFDTNQHWLAIELLGNGTWRGCIDFGTWSAPITDAAGSGGYTIQWVAGIDGTGTVNIDDIFYAVKRF